MSVSAAVGEFSTILDRILDSAGEPVLPVRISGTLTHFRIISKSDFTVAMALRPESSAISQLMQQIRS
jgi:hypothetical protein